MSKTAAEPALLERERERGAIEHLLGRARDGRGGVALVDGPPGIGKTALLGAAVAQAGSRDLRVLRARGLPLEQSFAFGVARQLLEPTLASASVGERRRLLGGAAALAEPVLAPAGATAGAIDGHAARHGLVWLVANLAAVQPVCVVVDDAHWADAPSQAWLLSLASRTDELALLLVVAVRRGDPAARAPALLDLAALPDVEVVRPAALSAPAVARLVRATLGDDADDAVCDACHAATGGNPFLAHELALALAERPPGPMPASVIPEFGAERVAAAVERRLARAPAGTLELARAVAVLGGDAELPQAAALAALDARDAEAASDALADTAVLAAGRPLRFVHPIVRVAVERGIPPGTRERLHRDAMALLHVAAAPPERLAAHVLAVAPAGDTAAIAVLEAAARAAARRGAPELAATYLRRALAEPPPAGQRAALAHALGLAEMANREPGATEHLREALALAAAADRPALALESARALGTAGRHIDAVELCQAGLTPRDDGPTAQLLEAELGINAGAVARLAPLARELLSAPRAHPLPPHRRAAEVWLRLARPGPLPRLAHTAERALAEIADDEQTLALTAALIVLIWTDHAETARPRLDRLVARARELGSPNGVAHFACFRGILAARAGRLPDAEADLWESVDFNLPEPTPEGMSWPLAYLLDVAASRGAGEAVLDAENVLGDDLGDWFGSALLVEHRGAFARHTGRPADALALLDDAARRWDELGVTGPPLASWRVERAHTLAQAGERGEAARLSDEHAELARHCGSTRELARALHARALSTTDAGAEPLLREAAALLAATPAQLEHARVLADLGDLLRRAGRRTDAREPLRQALDLSHRCGATRLAADVHERLRTTGARPRRPYLTGADALTPGEHRVAALAAAGRSNREIAQALFITLNTVESHLRSTFRKLDIANRSEIAAHLGGP